MWANKQKGRWGDPVREAVEALSEWEQWFMLMLFSVQRGWISLEKRTNESWGVCLEGWHG